MQTLDHGAVDNRQQIDFGSARLRALADKTIGRQLHELLWVPPSLPYHEPDGPYRGVDPVDCSKQLLFSSWAATPTAVASLLSYETDRLIDPPSSTVSRLEYRTDGDRPGAMTTLALFWPNPQLAQRCDPLALARHDGVTPASAETIAQRARQALESDLPRGALSRTSTAEAAYWQTAIGGFGPPPLSMDEVDSIVSALTGQLDASDEPDAPSRLMR